MSRSKTRNRKRSKKQTEEQKPDRGEDEETLEPSPRIVSTQAGVGAGAEDRDRDRGKCFQKDPNYPDAHPTSKSKRQRQRQQQQQQKQQAQHTAAVATNPDVSQPPGSHPFEVDDADHCETPLQAYQDLTVVLDRLLLQKESAGKRDDNGSATNNRSSPKRTSPARSSLRIYDPYYCDGGVKVKLAALGFTNVVNENRDFYKDMDTNQIPDHDVLITNPPYSGRHIERLLAFCAARQGKEARPALLLLPHFVYTKEYYARALAPATNPNGHVSFLIPRARYSYAPPAWARHRDGASRALARGKDATAPFPSFWYCCRLDGTATAAAAAHVSHRWLEATFGAAGSVRSKHASGLRYARMPKEIPRDFKGEFDPGKKRPNPRARKRLRKLSATGGNSGGPPPPRPQKQPQQQQQRDQKQKKQRRC